MVVRRPAPRARRAQSGDSLGILDPEGGAAVFGLAWAPNAELLVHLDFGGVSVWNVRRKRRIQRIEPDPDDVRSIVVLPDGRLATGLKDGTVLLWPLHADAADDALDRERRRLFQALCRGAGQPTRTGAGAYRQPAMERAAASVEHEGDLLSVAAGRGRVIVELTGAPSSPRRRLVLYCVEGHEPPSAPRALRRVLRWMGRWLEPAAKRAHRSERERALRAWGDATAAQLGARLDAVACLPDGVELAFELDEPPAPAIFVAVVTAAATTWLTEPAGG